MGRRVYSAEPCRPAGCHDHSQVRLASRDGRCDKARIDASPETGRLRYGLRDWAGHAEHARKPSEFADAEPAFDDMKGGAGTDSSAYQAQPRHFPCVGFAFGGS